MNQTPRFLTLLLAIGLLTLSACGQSGDLYLPDQTQSTSSTSQP